MRRPRHALGRLPRTPLTHSALATPRPACSPLYNIRHIVPLSNQVVYYNQIGPTNDHNLIPIIADNIMQDETTTLTDIRSDNRAVLIDSIPINTDDNMQDDEPTVPTHIQPAARAVVFDALGRVLLIRRGDNNRWALPAGGMEPGESVTECMKREVWEETGLTPTRWRAYAVYSHPRYHAPTRPEAQLLTVAFRVEEWEGDLRTETDETTDAQWFTPNELRDLTGLMPMYLEAIEDCLATTHGGFVVR